MSESGLWGSMRRVFNDRDVVYQRFEDKFSPGIPDVAIKTHNDKTAWVELKFSPKEAKAGRVQQLPHFTIEQRRFLTTWPQTFLFWRIDSTFLLFEDQFELLGHVPFDELYALSRHHWEGSVNWEVFLAVVASGRKLLR